MLDELFKTDCIKYGKFTLKSGEISKYYFDMKGVNILSKFDEENRENKFLRMFRN